MSSTRRSVARDWLPLAEREDSFSVVKSALSLIVRAENSPAKRAQSAITHTVNIATIEESHLCFHLSPKKEPPFPVREKGKKVT